MRTILFIVAFALSFTSKAHDIVWHQGSIVLVTSQVVVGDVVRGGPDLVLFKDHRGAITSILIQDTEYFR